MSVKMSIQGLSDVSAALGALPLRMSRKIQREALVNAAGPIQREASSIAPRAPGAPDLADNIAISNTRPPDGSVGVAVGPSTGFFYGSYQEFGTSRHGAQPFMRPAFDANVQAAFRQVLSETRSALIRRGLLSTGRSSGGGGGLL